jgi:hypothetical protein
MKDVASFIFMLVVIILLLVAGLIVRPMSCHAKWDKSGMPVTWSPMAGCQLQQKDGSWLPAEHYRQVN